VLVGDRDRELAARALRRHFAHGRISLAELSDRVDFTLHARSRDDLNKALRGLPPVWEDLPGGVHAAAWRLRRIGRRASAFLSLFRIWSKSTLALVVALGLALVMGAPAGAALGAFLVVWVVASYAFWRVWRRLASSP
jgi:hypothetical protein